MGGAVWPWHKARRLPVCQGCASLNRCFTTHTRAPTCARAHVKRGMEGGIGAQSTLRLNHLLLKNGEVPSVPLPPPTHSLGNYPLGKDRNKHIERVGGRRGINKERGGRGDVTRARWNGRGRGCDRTVTVILNEWVGGGPRLNSLERGERMEGRKE